MVRTIWRRSMLHAIKQPPHECRKWCRGPTHGDLWWIGDRFLFQGGMESPLEQCESSRSQSGCREEAVRQ